jgi:hypothetical protein
MKNFYLTLGICLVTTYSFSQNVGIGTPTPNYKLDVETTIATDGVQINATAADGDPVLQFQTNGTAEFTLGVDDSDADKFKIGTTAITTATSMTILANRDIAIRHTAPTSFFHMTNGGTAVGANAMASFDNLGTDGVALSGYNQNAADPYNGIEGITNYGGSAFITCGVFGLAINPSLTHTAIGVRGIANGRDGIGVYGSRQNTGGIVGWGGVFYNDLGYTGFFGVASDERAKKDVKKIAGALEIVSKLNPVTYNFDLDKFPNMGLNTEMEYGFLAQEVRTVLPEIVRDKKLNTNACAEVKRSEAPEDKSETFVVMDYTRIIPILTKAIQEQQGIIDQQQAQLEAMQLQIDELKE